MILKWAAGILKQANMKYANMQSFMNGNKLHCTVQSINDLTCLRLCAPQLSDGPSSLVTSARCSREEWQTCTTSSNTPKSPSTTPASLWTATSAPWSPSTASPCSPRCVWDSPEWVWGDGGCVLVCHSFQMSFYSKKSHFHNFSFTPVFNNFSVQRLLSSLELESISHINGFHRKST